MYIVSEEHKYTRCVRKHYLCQYLRKLSGSRILLTSNIERFAHIIMKITENPSVVSN